MINYCFHSTALTILSLFILGAVAPVTAQPDPFRQNEILGRGVNLPGVTDRAGTPVPDPPLPADHFPRIRKAGFDHLRVVVRWSGYSATEPPYTIQPDFFNKVDWIVEQSLRNDLAVILDFHYYPLISFTGLTRSQEDPKTNRGRFLALWKQISEHYRDAPAEVMFGLLNEPSRENLGVDGWNRLIADTIPLMRRTNPDRTILVATANGGGFGSIENLEIPAEERNVIVEVHYYSPGKFTHQEAPWSKNRIYKDVSWDATAEETGAVDADFSKVAAWARKNQRPLYLGEFGAYRAAPMDSRVRWTSFIARTAEKNGMSWAYWGLFRCGFELLDEEKNGWNQPLLKALIP